MRSIFLDTETTGLKPGQIAQLTYLIEENKELVAAKNYFFTVETMSIQAEMVHGFSIDKLAKLSQGAVFKDLHYDILEDFNNSTFIAHNVKFDRQFVEAELERINKTAQFKNYFCTMEYFKDIVKLPGKFKGGYKNPKVEEVLNFYKVSTEEVLDKTKHIFKCEDVGFHDARYDTVAMYICCLKSRNRNKVKVKWDNSYISI
jgi:DNA polymerase III epsilon subunit-like protein